MLITDAPICLTCRYGGHRDCEGDAWDVTNHCRAECSCTQGECSRAN